MRSTKVGRCDGPESLLTSSVPNLHTRTVDSGKREREKVRGTGGERWEGKEAISYLKFYSFIVNLYLLDLKIDAYGGNEGWRKGVVGVAEQQTGFADTRIPNRKELYLHIIAFTRALCCHF